MMQHRHLFLITSACAIVVASWLMFRPSSSSRTIAAPQSVAPPVVKLTPQPDHDPDEPDSPASHPLPPVSAAVRAKADSLIRQYRGHVPKDLTQAPELAAVFANMSSLMKRISAEDQRRLEATVEATKNVIGSKHGSISFAMDDMDSPATRALLEAVISDEPRRLADYMIRVLDGANFEYAFDPDLTKTSDGVSIRKADKPASNTPERD